MNWNPFTNAFPIVFVFAQQTEDVANAVKWTRENNVPIRMRIGSHALAKDFSQTNGGGITAIQRTTGLISDNILSATIEGIRAIRNFLEKATGNESNFFFLNSGGAINRIPPKNTAFFWRNTKYYLEWDTSWTKESRTQKNIKLVEQPRTRLQPYVTGSYVNVPNLDIKNYGQE
jgi:hypothetical protein